MIPTQEDYTQDSETYQAIIHRAEALLLSNDWATTSLGDFSISAGIDAVGLDYIRIHDKSGVMLNGSMAGSPYSRPAKHWDLLLTMLKELPEPT